MLRSRYLLFISLALLGLACSDDASSTPGAPDAMPPDTPMVDGGPTDGNDGGMSTPPDACVPAVCGADLCGTIDDGCGGTATCGLSCNDPESCGGGGEDNVCGCGEEVFSGTFTVNAATNFAVLAGVGRIDGTLVVRNFPNEALDGLNCLSDITGNLILEQNTALTSSTLLANLRRVGGDVIIRNNAGLTDLGVVASLSQVGGLVLITGNSALTSLDGLEQLTSVGRDLRVEDHAALTDISALAGVTQLRDLRVINNDVLNDLTGLENIERLTGNLRIEDNDALVVLDALAAGAGTGLTDVDGSITIANNPSLDQIDGLASVTQIGADLIVSGNAQLTSVDGMTGLTQIGGELRLADNAALTALDGLNALTSAQQVTIENNGLASLGGLNGLTSVTANVGSEAVTVSNNAALTSIAGLTTLATIDGRLRIEQNLLLTNIAGLAALRTIGGDLSVVANTALVSIESLLGLTELGGDLSVTANTSLPTCQADALLAQVTANGFDGTAIISGNDDAGVCGSAYR
ncbi:MAG: hypothetical protein Tsb0020_24650 [Haliangiales bacterium]